MDTALQYSSTLLLMFMGDGTGGETVLAPARCVVLLLLAGLWQLADLAARGAGGPG